MEDKKKRGRPRKATEKQISEIDNGLNSLGISESLDEFVNDYLTENGRKIFSANLLKQIQDIENISKSYGSTGTTQPILSQSMLQRISFRSLPCSSEELENWLKDPSINSQKLQAVSYWLSNVVGQYRQLIWTSSTSKAFHADLVPMTKDSKVNKLLKKLNYKYQLSKIDLDVMYNGVSFCWYGITENSFSLIKLPKEYCYLTAPWDYGFLYSFDLTYFDRFIGMEMAIPELSEAYDKLIEARKDGLQGKELAQVQYYPVSPLQGWCFYYNPVNPDKTPPFVSSMTSALDILSYKDLLKNNAILSLFRILALKIPINSETKKMSLSYNEASAITQVIQSTLPDNVIAYSSPFDTDQVNVDQSQRMESLIGIGNNAFASSTGVPDAFFGGSGVRQGTALQLFDQINFYKNSYHMYRQYENFVNWLIMWLTTSQSRIHFHGNNVTDSKDCQDYSTLVKTANMPVGRLFSYYYEPYEILDTLNAEKDLGIKELMTPIISGFNSKNVGLQNPSGRPQTDDLSEGGQNQRDYESNLNR